MRKADNLPPSCAVVTKSGNPNFLEPSGSVQACNGTALFLWNIKFRNAFPTCQKTRCVFNTKTNRLILFSATVTVYPEVTRNQDSVWTKWNSVTVKAGSRIAATALQKAIDS